MPFTDKLKQKAAEFDLAGKAQMAKEKAAELADTNRDKIAGAVDKAGSTIDSKTGGKYHDTIVKAQGAAMSGVNKVAEQRTAGGARVGTQGATGDVTRAEAGEKAYAAEDFAGETPVDRAVGADAPASSLDLDARRSRLRDGMQPGEGGTQGDALR